MGNKEDRKTAVAAAMRKDREDRARAWTEEKAKTQVTRGVSDHADLMVIGTRGVGEAFYLRSDMAMQASVNPGYDAALKAAAPELYIRVMENEKGNVSVDLTAFHAANNSGGARKAAKGLGGETARAPVAVDADKDVRFVGPITEVVDGLACQKVGRTALSVVWHDVSKVAGDPLVIGQSAEVHYRNGTAHASSRSQQKETNSVER